jgi:Peptidase family M50
MAKRPSAGALVASTLIGMLCAAVGYFVGKGVHSQPAIAHWLEHSVGSLTGWDWLVFPVLFLLVIAIHELGHLLGGLSQGMRFLLLIFGPFQWNATKDGIRFRWVTNLGVMGGVAATLPVRMDNLRQQLIPMIAGGPLASLLLAMLAAVLSFSGTGRLAGYAAVVGLLSLAIFVVTAIPFRAGGFMSDGMQLLEVRRGGQSVIERADLIAVMATSLGGVRPRDWDAALMARLEAMNSAEPLRLLACWMILLQRAMDCGDASQSAHYAKALADRIDDYPDGFRQSLHIELCLEAALRQDREAAEHHLARTKGGVTERSRLELARALVFALQGDAASAERHRSAGQKALRQAMDPGLALLTADQLAANQER